MDKIDKRYLIPVGLVAAAFICWLAFGFFGVQALFMDQQVDEAVPLLVPATDNPVLGGAPMPEARVSFGEGDFVQGDSTYRIKGKATLFQDGEIMKIALTDFDVTNGPDLYVYVVDIQTTDNASVKASVAEGFFVSLGKLKGNIGDQVYELPKGFDAKNKVVSIWCQRFSRNFGSALVD